jgi:tRNA (cmo5U34)-methyltransferase
MYATANSNIYDLGCSLGASSMALLNYIKAPGVRLYAVDNSADMVKGCRANLQTQDSPVEFEVVQADLSDYPIEKASVVVMNFILQFVPKDERDQVLSQIYQGLNGDGVLIIAEKTNSQSTTREQNLQHWHEGFKLANGYSELEIAQKRSALENVLVTETEAELSARLENASFAYVQKWFQAFGFKAFIAFKK